jgi:hypothetical protein
MGEMPKPMTVTPDAKGRITLGKLAKGVSSYRVFAGEDGKLVLEPWTEIPTRELWLYKNPKALEMVEKGLQESAEGKTSDMGDFSQYLTDDEA